MVEKGPMAKPSIDYHFSIDYLVNFFFSFVLYQKNNEWREVSYLCKINLRICWQLLGLMIGEMSQNWKLVKEHEKDHKHITCMIQWMELEERS